MGAEGATMAIANRFRRQAATLRRLGKSDPRR
jgi:hypothetical protein